VIAEQLLMLDIDVTQWVNLLAMFGNGGERPSLLVCLVDGDRCVKTWHSQKGVLWGFDFPGLDNLEQARAAADAEFVLCLPRGALQEIFYHAQAHVAPSDDYVKQLLNMISHALEAFNRVAVWHPKKPFTLKLPSYEWLERLFARLWPDNTTLGLFVFERRRVHTSLILGKASGQINLFTTLDGFGMAEKSLDFRLGHRVVAELIGQRYASLHTGLFIELPCLQEMRRGPKPLSYLHLAEKRGRALVYPKPFSLRWRLWAARRFLGK